MDGEILRAVAAANVIVTCTPSGVSPDVMRDVSARELNAMVAVYPPPAVSIERLGLDAGDVPILFVDMDFGGVIQLLGAWMTNVGMPFPVFYMPTDIMDKWNGAPGVAEFITYLNERGLDLQLSMGGTPIWLKGHWVILVDVRLRFAEGVPFIELHQGLRALTAD
jgi:hypothetical protein